jgi:predicted short-subunit dehydrogenase-like oxidoreductase (DUF2520 family)
MSIDSIVLIGAGNVATQLGKAFFRKGKSIKQVLSRTMVSAELLATRINAEPIVDPDMIADDADLYILAVPDDEIENLLATLNFHDRLIVHTSGSMGMDVLKNASSNYGVFYPLQTFSKTRDIDFSDIPVCIEACDDDTSLLLINLAGEISADIRKINSAQRQKIHLSAIFASNFTNHMYTLADEILEKENVSFDILLPLIRETAKKIESKSPKDAQTGPAIRGDMKIIEKHIQDLQSEPGKLVLYKIISKLIMDGHW